MIAFLGNIMGKLLFTVYELISKIGTEPKNFSFYAMSIILTTIIFKLILLPLNIKQAKATKSINKMQPEMQKIQKKYKDPQTQQIKIQELYKKHNFNPAAGCLLPLIQLPILFAFLAVFREPAKYAFTQPGLYESLNKTFFWIKNLEHPDPYLWGLPLLAGITTYIHSKLMMPKDQSSDNPAASSQQTMVAMMPLLIFWTSTKFAAGLALYWVVNNIISIIQQLIINRANTDSVN